MKIIEILQELIQIGIDTDPRGKKFVQGFLKDIQTKYAKLEDKEKKYFDQEKLTNPYLDSRVYYETDADISTVMLGIDVETPELLLLDALKKKGQKIDAAITHHPEGLGLSNLDDVMSLQTGLLHKFGVPINIAESIMNTRISDVSKGLMPINYNRTVDAAKLLDIPFMGVHTPSDNCVSDCLQKRFDEENPRKLQDIIEVLLEFEEYQISYKDNNSPKIINGNKNSSCGKIYVDMTGGTEGPAVSIEKLANAGVGTIVGMHMSPKHLEKAKECYVNILIAGHMSSDTLGLNLLFDKLERRKGELEFISCSGFKRIKRI
ncbi:MAG: NGG1p interacting factor NIF3 [bacterium]|nr:NGG1p interacting factor NIF3 [bacterium]